MHNNPTYSYCLCVMLSDASKPVAVHSEICTYICILIHSSKLPEVLYIEFSLVKIQMLIIEYPIL